MSAYKSSTSERLCLLAIADVLARYRNVTLGASSATVGTLHCELLDKRH